MFNSAGSMAHPSCPSPRLSTPRQDCRHWRLATSQFKRRRSSIAVGRRFPNARRTDTPPGSWRRGRWFGRGNWTLALGRRVATRWRHMPAIHAAASASPKCPWVISSGTYFYAALSKGCLQARAQSMRWSRESSFRVNFHSKVWRWFRSGGRIPATAPRGLQGKGSRWASKALR